jgi:hypothetical protein|tara:strand:+ start:836 stop:1162 length:327 start_codon:yes stop_codon:yes gene_type:complete
MDWSSYKSKKGKTVDFAKKEKEISPAKKEIKNDDGEVIQAKTEAIKKSYIALVQKKWDAESGEALADSEREYSLLQLESEKAKYDADITRAKEQSDGLAFAIEDFKKL